MKCQNPKCHKEIDHEKEARLVTTEEFIEVIVDCPHCMKEHYTSFRPDELILSK